MSRGLARVLFAWVLLLTAGARAQTHPTALAAAAPERSEKPKISPGQAEELFQSVEDILKFVSEDSKLPIQHKIKRKLVDRDTVEKDLTERLKNDEDSQRMEHAEVVLKKFGFLPKDFHLRQFFISMMREQVAGYYNVKDQTVYLLDWIEPAAQRAILAHELTHALQDQNFHLEKWNKSGPEEKEKKKWSPENLDPMQESSDDEQLVARVALLEGQGMVELLDYALASRGRNVNNSPSEIDALKRGMTEDKQSPIFNSAPRFLKESLVFPYREGLTFIQEVMFKKGREAAFAGTMANPPKTTREIMQPSTYLAQEKIPPLPLPRLQPILGSGYSGYDAGAMGEFDVATFLAQFRDPEKRADDLYREWRGGTYFAALRCDLIPCEAATKQQKNQSPAVSPPTNALALLYLSRWSRPESAARFAEQYRNALLKRYKFAQGGTPKVGDAPTNRWMTDEGLVSIDVRGNQVLVLESFDEAAMKKVSDAIWQPSASAAN
jgi:hypothetical protein